MIETQSGGLERNTVGCGFVKGDIINSHQVFTVYMDELGEGAMPHNTSDLCRRSNQSERINPRKKLIVLYHPSSVAADLLNYTSVFAAGYKTLI